MLGELRAKMLLGGVRLAEHREDAQITLEVRSQGCSIDCRRLGGAGEFYIFLGHFG